MFNAMLAAYSYICPASSASFLPPITLGCFVSVHVWPKHGRQRADAVGWVERRCPAVLTLSTEEEFVVGSTTK